MALYAHLKRIFPKDCLDMTYVYHNQMGNVLQFIRNALYASVTHVEGHR